MGSRDEIKSRLDQVGDWAELAKAANYSVKVLAGKCGVSRRQLHRVISKRTKMPPHRWLTELRQMQALTLLKGGVPPKAVASQLGYDRLSTFSHEFKMFYGVAPRVVFRSLSVSVCDVPS
jgi:AraC-like DNA-binding protein